MKLVVGLGNPGTRYTGTRHNAGFEVVERLMALSGVQGKEKFKGIFAKGIVAGTGAGLLLPMTFMNRSGDSVRQALDFYSLEPKDIIVVHDELDLPLGRLRLKQGGGHGGHNGLRSISQQIGSDYVRLRCGIGRPEKGDVTGFVLGRYSTKEQTTADAMTDSGVDAISAVLRDGIVAAMNVVNTWQ